jgi:predicted acylesterase/phospholipase RssA
MILYKAVQSICKGGNDMEYDLVFEGGGAKGLAFVGALKTFERRGHTPRRLIGSSAGSITACLIAAGYNSQENLAAISEKLPDGRPRFTSFMDTPTIYEDIIIRDQLGYWLRTELDNPAVPNLIEPVVDSFIEGIVKNDLVRHLISLLLWGGWYAGDAFMSWLSEKLDANGRALAGSTLTEFHQKTKRDLSVVASDLTGKEMLVLNHRTAPTLPTVCGAHVDGLPFCLAGGYLETRMGRLSREGFERASGGGWRAALQFSHPSVRFHRRKHRRDHGGGLAVRGCDRLINR